MMMFASFDYSRCCRQMSRRASATVEDVEPNTSYQLHCCFTGAVGGRAGTRVRGAGPFRRPGGAQRQAARQRRLQVPYPDPRQAQRRCLTGRGCWPLEGWKPCWRAAASVSSASQLLRQSSLPTGLVSTDSMLLPVFTLGARLAPRALFLGSSSRHRPQLRR